MKLFKNHQELEVRGVVREYESDRGGSQWLVIEAPSGEGYRVSREGLGAELEDHLGREVLAIGHLRPGPRGEIRLVLERLEVESFERASREPPPSSAVADDWSWR